MATARGCAGDIGRVQASNRGLPHPMADDEWWIDLRDANNWEGRFCAEHWAAYIVASVTRALDFERRLA